jgi:uncharacterized protein YjgD (DUF1641 family)
VNHRLKDIRLLSQVKGAIIVTETLDRPEVGDQTAALLARLNDPKTVTQLNSLLDNVDILTGLLQIVGSFLRSSEQIMDNARDLLKEMQDKMLADGQVGTLAKSFVMMGQQALPLVDKIAETNALQRVVDSDVVEPQVIDMVAKVLGSMKTVQQEIIDEPEHPRISMMRLPMMMRDRDFNRGMDYLFRVVRELGAAVKPDGFHGVGPGDGTKQEKAQLAAQLQTAQIAAQQAEQDAPVAKAERK